MQLSQRGSGASSGLYAGMPCTIPDIPPPDTVSARLLPALIAVSGPSITTAPRRDFAPSIGIFFYLVSVAIVAAVTIGVFFGVALSLLRQPANALVAEWLIRGHGSNIGTVPQGGLPRGGGAAPANYDTAAAAAKAAQQLPSAAPDNSETAPPAAKAVQQVPSAAPAKPRPAIAVAGPAPKTGENVPGNAAAKITVAPRMPDGQLAELLSRGDIFLRAGDIASARLFYERAADAGDGQAALRVGATFDPTFLASVGLRNVSGDLDKARFWYHRARSLGAREAEPHLNSLETK